MPFFAPLLLMLFLVLFNCAFVGGARSFGQRQGSFTTLVDAADNDQLEPTGGELSRIHVGMFGLGEIVRCAKIELKIQLLSLLTFAQTLQ